MINWHKYSKKLSTPQFIILNIALGIGHFMTVLSAGAFLPMLPHVAGSLGEGLPFTVWGQSNYVAAMGAAFLIARPVMRKYGPKNTAIFAYLLFALMGCLVLMSISVYPIYTAARTIQGFAAGLSITPSLFLLLEQYKAPKHKVAISLWSLAAFTPFSVGPALGGYFAYVVGDWRMLFVFFSGLSFIVVGVIWALLGAKVDHQDRSYQLSNHLMLFVLFISIVISLQTFFNIGILTDLTSREYESWWVLCATLIFMWLFWVANSEVKHPLLDFSIFTHRNYAFGLVLMSVAFMAIQASIVQYVLRLQLVEGYTAWQAGLIFLPIFLFSKPMSVVTQHAIHRGYDPRLLACISFIGFAFSFWWMGEYMRPTTWQSLLWPMFIEGAALGMFFVSMANVTMSNIPDKEQLHAVDVLNTLRTVCAALAITFSDIAWDYHVAWIRHHLIAADSGNIERYVMSVTPLTNDSASAMQHVLQSRLVMQSGLLTLNSMFHTLAIAFVIFAVVIWFASASHIVHKDKKLDRIVESLGEEP